MKEPSNGELNQALGDRYGQNFDVWLNTKANRGRDYPLAKLAMDTAGQNSSMRVNYSEPIFLHLNPKNEIWYKLPQLWRVEEENYKNNEWVISHCQPFPYLETRASHD